MGTGTGSDPDKAYGHMGNSTIYRGDEEKCGSRMDTISGVRV